MTLIRRACKALSALVLFVLIGVGALVAAFRIEHSRDVTLPRPSGPYLVGRAAFDWLDSARIDPVAPSPGVGRELTVWIWYPADSAQAGSAQPVQYLPARLRQALDSVNGPVMRGLFTRALTGVHPHALAEVPLAGAKDRWPVVLFKPGIGALALDYTTILEDLASQGYVVVASDSPHSTTVVVYEDGRVATRTPAGNPADGRAAPEEVQRFTDSLVPVWAADFGFLLDRLARLDARDPAGRFQGRLDLDSIGAFGHSFGGAAAAQFCRDDPRCAAAVDIDGQPFGDVATTGLRKPLLVILADHGETPEEAAVRRTIDVLTARVPNRPAQVTLAGTRHFNFSDQALLKERLITSVGGMVGPIDRRRALELTAAAVHRFFDRWLAPPPDRAR